jgi:group I intron endonuclease
MADLEPTEVLFCIYKLTNRVTGQFYVGSTSDLESRLRGHAHSGTGKSTTTLSENIREHGISSFDVCVLESGIPAPDRFVRERHYIKSLGATGANGLNMWDMGNYDLKPARLGVPVTMWLSESQRCRDERMLRVVRDMQNMHS